MRDNESGQSEYGQFDWARDLIAAAEAPVVRPAPVARIRPERHVIAGSRTADGSFGQDSNVIQVRVADDGMAVYTLRQSAAL
jgi:hypothetical protein